MTDRMKPKPPEHLPSEKPKQKLRETVKPKNRKKDNGGAIVAVGSSVLLGIAAVSESVVEVTAMLLQLGLPPDTVAKVSGGLGLFGLIWSAATQAKE